MVTQFVMHIKTIVFAESTVELLFYYYPTLYFLNFQLSNLNPNLPTPFKPDILAFLLSDLSVNETVISPNCYSPKTVA